MAVFLEERDRLPHVPEVAQRFFAEVNERAKPVPCQDDHFHRGRHP